MAVGLSISRKGDWHKTGHGCHTFAPLVPPTGNITVFAEKMLMCRIGDWDAPHTIPCPCPAGICCCIHATVLMHGHPDIITVGKFQSTKYSAIDLGFMFTGALFVKKSASNEAVPGTYAKAGGGGLDGTGAGSMADGGNTSMSAPMEF